MSTLLDLFENYHVKQFVLSATLRNEYTFQAFLDGCGSFGFLFPASYLNHWLNAIYIYNVGVDTDVLVV